MTPEGPEANDKAPGPGAHKGRRGDPAAVGPSGGWQDPEGASRYGRSRWQVHDVDDALDERKHEESMCHE